MFLSLMESALKIASDYYDFGVNNNRQKDLLEMYGKISEKLNDEQQVIIVAHSQRNLFANELSLALFEPGYGGFESLGKEKAKRFGIMHLASPFGSSFHNNSESVLVKQDKVISGYVSKLDSGINANYVLSDQ